jgi:hypothetical protein
LGRTKETILSFPVGTLYTGLKTGPALIVLWERLSATFLPPAAITARSLCQLLVLDAIFPKSKATLSGTGFAPLAAMKVSTSCKVVNTGPSGPTSGPTPGSPKPYSTITI